MISRAQEAIINSRINLPWFSFLSETDDDKRGHLFHRETGLKREFHYIRMGLSHFHEVLNPIMKLRPKSFVDVGCGGGDKLAYVKARWPKVHVTGIEHDPEMAIWASLYGDEVICADALTQDYSNYDVIYAYWPIADYSKMDELVGRIGEQMKQDSVFVLFGCTFITSPYKNQEWQPKSKLKWVSEEVFIKK